jgi:hypothetical protein
MASVCLLLCAVQVVRACFWPHGAAKKIMKIQSFEKYFQISREHVFGRTVRPKTYHENQEI